MMTEEEINRAEKKCTTVFYLSGTGEVYGGNIIRCPFGQREIYFKGSNGSSEKKISKEVKPVEISLTIKGAALRSP